MIPILCFSLTQASLSSSKQGTVVFFSIVKTACINLKKKFQKVAHSWLGVFAAAIPTSLADLKVVQEQMYNYLPAVKAGGVFR